MSKARVKTSPDRRAKSRFKLKLEMRFRICRERHMSRWAKGVIADISSGGASFRCSKPCPIGSYVELIIDWPVKRDEQHPLSMEATGVIVRQERGRIGMRFTSNELRLQNVNAVSMSASN